MTKEIFDSLVTVLRGVYTNFTCKIDPKTSSKVNLKSEYKYRPDFCNPDLGCQRMDKNLEIFSDFLSTDYRQGAKINLTYPALKIYGREIIWADIVRGVTLDENNVVTDIKMIILPLQFQVKRWVLTQKLMRKMFWSFSQFKMINYALLNKVNDLNSSIIFLLTHIIMKIGLHL